jgi:hypothetical protein
MDIWWLHALVFIFGYTTCKTFYFLNTARISLKLIKSSRVIYLLMAVRAIENYLMSERMMNKYLKETKQDKDTVKSFEDKCVLEIEHFKKKTIEQLLLQTPDAFKPGLEFDDWRTAMNHLQQHKEEALDFWRMGK